MDEYGTVLKHLINSKILSEWGLLNQIIVKIEYFDKHNQKKLKLMNRTKLFWVTPYYTGATQTS